jgi:hypothetical protein
MLTVMNSAEYLTLHTRWSINWYHHNWVRLYILKICNTYIRPGMKMAGTGKLHWEGEVRACYSPHWQHYTLLSNGTFFRIIHLYPEPHADLLIQNNWTRNELNGIPLLFQILHVMPCGNRALMADTLDSLKAWNYEIIEPWSYQMLQFIHHLDGNWALQFKTSL